MTISILIYELMIDNLYLYTSYAFSKYNNIDDNSNNSI